MTHSTTGSCWYIVYNGSAVKTTVVNHSDNVWTISKTDMDWLTCASFLVLLSDLFADAYCSDNQAEVLGTIEAPPVPIKRSMCSFLTVERDEP